MQASASTRPLALQENLEIVWPGTPTNFPREWLGYDQDHLLYTFFQESPDHPNGWGGMETFVRPPGSIGPSEGYGALEGRIWFKNFLAEAGGQVVASDSFNAPRLHLSEPRRPLWGQGVQPGDTDVTIERTDNGDMRFTSRAGTTTLSQLMGSPAPPPPAQGTAVLPLIAIVGLLAVAAVAASRGGKKLVFK